jgi:putative glycosyltransferase (TIGR04348 family)
MPARTLLIVTPALAVANNGNWRTAVRWSRLLAPSWRAILQSPDMPLAGGRRDEASALIALHARRSRAAIAAWKALHPQRPLIVALTGTDLYRDVPAGDPDALASLVDADRLIVLQEDAIAHVPRAPRDKVRVVYQSARSLRPFAPKSTASLHCLLVAHLRDEKDPRTAFEAWRRLDQGLPATLTIVGGALDEAIASEARALSEGDPRVRYVGPRPHAWTRQAIKRAHLLLVSSRMEGGANVVVEAVTSGTPVVGSRMSGNVGMLGDAYPGLFAVGDADALARLVERAHVDRSFLAELGARCDAQRHRFSPATERETLRRLLDEALATAESRMTGTPTPGRYA